MNGILIVSHSPGLAMGACELAQELIPGLDVPVRVAAGDIDGGLGTNVLAISEALSDLGEQLGEGDGIVVISDVGSSVLAAATAKELIEPSLAERVHLSPAPFVEGLIAAYAAAGTGSSFDQVCELTAQAASDKEQMIRQS